MSSSVGDRGDNNKVGAGTGIRTRARSLGSSDPTRLDHTRLELYAHFMVKKRKEVLKIYVENILIENDYTGSSRVVERYFHLTRSSPFHAI